MKLSEELEARGFVHQFVGDSLSEILDGEKRVVYHGIDPSADSAHVGNMVSWIMLRHLAQAGYKVIFLVGGGTGRIGDPKPDSEREPKAAEEVDKNVAGLKKQAEEFFEGIEGGVEFVNNLEWLDELKFVDFLRDVGKCFTVNELIKKDAIARRLESDTGLSYTEFAYPLMQGYDYLQLHQSKNCTLQVGGSDQWGNIVSGVDLVRRKEQTDVYAVTIPLIVDKVTGKKFGKSEGNAVWLNPEKTSPYMFYQFWLNVADEGVIDYLKLFTFLSLEDIMEIERINLANPSERAAQKTLAREVTTLVHGPESANAAVRVSEVLFGSASFSSLTEVELDVVKSTAPCFEVGDGQFLVDVLVSADLASSKREARTFIEGGGVEVNKTKVTDVEAILSKENDGENVFIKRGKKQYAIATLL